MAELHSDPNLHVLIIGIDEYKHYPGAKLEGAVTDARLWRDLTLKLGAVQTNINMLLSTDRVMPTTARINGALDDLAADLAGPGRKKGILVFAGHGTVYGNESCIVPSDTDPEWNGLIRISEIHDRFVEQHGFHLFSVFDCCTSEELDGNKKGRALTRGLRSRFLRTDGSLLHRNGMVDWKNGDPHISDLRAAEGATYEFPSHEIGWRGSFTWAVMHVLSLWLVRGTEQGERYVGLTFKTLRNKVIAVLEAGMFEQTPIFRGKNGRPVFAGGSGELETTLEPILRRRQLSGGNKGYRTYHVKNSSGVVVGRVFVISLDYNQGGGFVEGREYWALKPGTPSLAALSLSTNFVENENDQPSWPVVGWAKLEVVHSAINADPTGTLPAEGTFHAVDKDGVMKRPYLRFELTGSQKQITWIRPNGTDLFGPGYTHDSPIDFVKAGGPLSLAGLHQTVDTES